MRCTARRSLIAALAVFLYEGSAAALPSAIDADADGHLDAMEVLLGSDPGSAASTPESVAVAGSCLDGTDNDGDTTTDGADAGCTAPEPSDTTFPGAGTDVFDSSLTLDTYPFAVGGSICVIDLDGGGPVVVQRGAPGGSPASIPVEILAMQLTGTGTVLSGGPGCPPPGDYPITIIESLTQSSVGVVTDANTDPASDFPASSFFDVFFDVVVGIMDTEITLPGGPPNGPAGMPVRVENTIGMIPPYQGGKTTLCYQVPGLQHEHCPKAPPDHYTCYTGKFSPKFQPRDVTLRDQFDGTATGTSARVLKPQFFCNPTAKNGEPLYEPTGHLTCYRLKPQKTERMVAIRNQFGQKTITTRKSKMLCVPSEKNTEGPPQQLDHFKCYSAKFPKTQPRPVTLVDQFGTLQEQVLKPFALCNPVMKNGEPIRNPLHHLECYKIAPKSVRQTVTARNQFGEATVKVKKTALLCLPTGKNEITATTTTTVPGGTTTTTIPTIGLMLGWTHPTPGLPPSILCGKVNGPPNSEGSVNITGPSPGTTQVSLNGQGVGRFQHQIFSFGTYTVGVDVNGLMASGMATVDASDPMCP